MTTAILITAAFIAVILLGPLALNLFFIKRHLKDLFCISSSSPETLLSAAELLKGGNIFYTRSPWAPGERSGRRPELWILESDKARAWRLLEKHYALEETPTAYLVFEVTPIANFKSQSKLEP